MFSRREFLAAGSLLPGLRLLAQDVTFSTGVDVVNVLVSVRNKNGDIIRDLKKDDFKLEEDGHVQPIKYFSQQTDLALTLGLLVDTSGSQRYVLGEERKASLQFLRGVMREDRDMAFVIHFDGEVELLQDLTSSKHDLEESLSDIQTPEQTSRGGYGRGGGGGRGRGRRGGGGPINRSAAGTALYDAVLLSSDDMMKKQSGRKAVILLSDGVDQGSKVTLNHAIEAAQRADTLVYGILFTGVPNYPRRSRGSIGPVGLPGSTPPLSTPIGGANGARVMQRISRETGGAYFEVTEKTPLDKIYKRIEEELRNQYSLGYSPDKGTKGYRKIKVLVAQKGLNVQARDGYYSN